MTTMHVLLLNLCNIHVKWKLTYIIYVQFFSSFFSCLTINDVNVLTLLSAVRISLDSVMQIKVRSPVSDCLENQIVKNGRGDAQIGKGAGVLIDDLVNEHALDLIRRNGGPVDVLTESGQELVDLLGEVDLFEFVQGGFLDHGVDLGHGVLLGAVQFVGFAGCRVVVSHDFERGGNVEHRDRAQLFLIVVRREDSSLTGNAVKEVVAGTVHDGGSHNGHIGDDFADGDLAKGLGAVEFGGRVDVGVESGDVDEAGDIVLFDSGGDTAGTLDMDVFVREVLGWVFAAHEVVDDIRVLDGVLDRLNISKIHFDKVDNAEVTSNLQVTLLHFFSEGHDCDGTFTCQARDKVAAEETVGAKHSGSVTGS